MSISLRIAIASITTAGTVCHVAAQTLTYQRIVDSNTLVPNGNGARFDGSPAFQGLSLWNGSVSFGGRRGDGTKGYYRFQCTKQGCATGLIADSTTTIPGTSVAFNQFEVQTGSSAAGVVFEAGRAGVGSGIYSLFGQVLDVVVDYRTQLPSGERLTGGKLFHDLSGERVALLAYPQPSNSPVLFLWDQGTLSVIADSQTPVPDGTGTFRAGGNQFRIGAFFANDGIVFWGVDSAEHTGLYHWNGKSIVPVWNRSTPGPAGEGNFQSVIYFNADGNDLAAFAATEFGNPQGGLYTLMNGQARLIANIGDQGPTGFPLQGFQGISIQNGTVVWRNGGDFPGVYAFVRGEIVAVAAPGMSIDGTPVRSATFGPWARDENQVAVSAVFTNDVSGHRNQAIYIVTLPCAADYDSDGFVTGADFDLFTQMFESGDQEADFDGDGFVTGADFDLFVHVFEAGC